MSKLQHVALFFALIVSASFCNTNMTAMESADEETEATMNFHIGLPKETRAVGIACSSDSFVGVSGQDHEWTVPVNHIESCHALWDPSSSSFNAFEPSSDAGHAHIYWLANLDGFFHSWDQVNWDKRAAWVGFTQH